MDQRLKTSAIVDGWQDISQWRKFWGYIRESTVEFRQSMQIRWTI